MPREASRYRRRPPHRLGCRSTAASLLLGLRSPLSADGPGFAVDGHRSSRSRFRLSRLPAGAVVAALARANIPRVDSHAVRRTARAAPRLAGQAGTPLSLAGAGLFFGPPSRL